MVVDEGIHQNLDPSPMDSGACTFNSFLTTGDTYCLMLITYASNFAHDQDRLKKIILKKKKTACRRQQKHEKLPSMQKFKEGFDARAISAIKRRAVKCSGETVQLVRITCAFFGHS